MPVITIDIGTVTRDVKEALVRRVTAGAAEATGIPEEKFIILINELPTDNIGVGGRLLTELKAQVK